MSETWYYNDSGRAAGPFNVEQMRGLMASGKVTPGTLVWNSSIPDWQVASSLPEIAPEQAPAAPPPPTPAPPPQQPQMQPQPRPVQPLPAPVPYAGPTTRSDHATAALILAVLSFMPCFGFVIGIVAIVLSLSALSAAERERNSCGRSTAMAALIVAIVAMVGRFSFIGLHFLPWHWSRGYYWRFPYF